MNIETMTKQEKSNALIMLMGWRKKWTDMHSMILLDSDGCGVGYRLMQSGEKMPDLYDSTNMALAWRVLNWASSQKGIYPELMRWWFRQDSDLDMLGGYLFDWEPKDAQRAWLDKVLSLAIEANLIEKEPALNG